MRSAATFNNVRMRKDVWMSTFVCKGLKDSLKSFRAEKVYPALIIPSNTLKPLTNARIVSDRPTLKYVERFRNGLDREHDKENNLRANTSECPIYCEQ